MNGKDELKAVSDEQTATSAEAATADLATAESGEEVIDAEDEQEGEGQE